MMMKAEHNPDEQWQGEVTVVTEVKGESNQWSQNKDGYSKTEEDDKKFKREIKWECGQVNATKIFAEADRINNRIKRKGSKHKKKK